jgi:ATP-dependent DNA helicase RecG
MTTQKPRRPPRAGAPKQVGTRPTKTNALAREIALGEDSTRQFKRDITHADALAAEMAAFANAEGGTLYLGVADDGSTPGLAPDDVKRLNQLIGNVANHAVRSALTVSTKNVALPNGRIVIVVTVPKGLDKPYFDRSGVIWLKAGADKRRINSREELRRFFQLTDPFHADELPTKAILDALDAVRFRDFLRDTYDQPLPSRASDRLRLLVNLNLATHSGALNLAGLLLFGEQPQRFKPQFVVKSVAYPGRDIHVSAYEDTEDFAGPLRRVFDGALAFILRNLRKVQGAHGVNSPGTPEVPPIVFEELLVNALVHRDYLVSAPIRIFVFDDRVDIISPGTLPNHLTVANIRVGNSNLRNPILASFAAKGLLPYRGLGSGIPRALEAWPDITFRDDRDGALFVASVSRARAGRVRDAQAPGLARTPTPARPTPFPGTTLITPQITPPSPTRDIPWTLLSLLRAEPRATRNTLASAVGLTPDGVKYHLRRLRDAGLLRRIGPDHGGHWEVRDPAPAAPSSRRAPRR